MLGSLLLISSVLCGPAEGATSDPLRAQVQRLVRQLDDNALAKRDAAEQALIGLGAEALKTLPPVTAKTPTEVKVRLDRIRNTLEKAAAEAAAQASLVTLQGALPLSQALAALEQQTHNKIVDLREKFGQQRTDPQVTANFKKTPFWKALDELLAQAGLTLYSFGGQPGTIAFVSRGDGQAAHAPTAGYSGLFRFEGVRIQASRDLRNPANQSLRLTLEVNWEPRLSPILVQLPLADLHAQDEAGHAIPVDSQLGKLEAPVESTIPAVELQVPLVAPERGVKKIASLSGTLLALVPGQIETFEFSDLETVKGAEQRRGGVSLVLDQRKNLDVYELRLRVRFDKAENALESHRGWIYSNEAYLVDAGGKQVDNAGYQAFLQEANEVGVAYLFDHEPGLKGCKFVYKTPAALVKIPAQFLLQDIPPAVRPAVFESPVRSGTLAPRTLAPLDGAGQRRGGSCFPLALLLALASAARAQEAPAPDHHSVARVDGETISAREVERELARAIHQRPLPPETKRALRAETIRQLVNRRLVLRYLTATGVAASAQDLTQSLNRIRKQLEQQKQTLPDYLQQAGLTEAELKHNLAWQISWQRCLERQLTEANLERYFHQHRRDFDGTTLRVAHILFKVEPPDDREALAKALVRAEHLREEIRAGKRTFAAAAQQHSVSPSGQHGGELGEISRHDPMPEPFSQAAFALAKGEISPPVVTTFGVHLILCQELQAGQKAWPDVRGELEQAVAQYLFQWMADRQRPKSQVELLETAE